MSAAGSNTSWNANGGVLSQSNTAPSDPKKAIINLTYDDNAQIVAKVRVDSWQDSYIPRDGVGLNTDSNGNGYNLVFHNNGIRAVQFLNDVVAWSNAVALTGPTTPGTGSSGGTLYGRVWQDGTLEPSTWTDAQNLGGSFGPLRLKTVAGNSTSGVYDYKNLASVGRYVLTDCTKLNGTGNDSLYNFNVYGA